MLTLDIMRKRWPNGDQHVSGLMEGIVASCADVFGRYGIADKPLAIAHFMAQASEECGQGLEMRESLNYTAARLRQVWPDHFTPTMAQRYAHNQEMIGEIAYGGRMGNAPPPSTDGYDYRGAGLTQTTGRDGVTDMQKVIDAHRSPGSVKEWDVVENPELIVDPEYTLECGVADWIACNCLDAALADNTLLETKRLNGGTIGLSERRRQLALWKVSLGL